MDNELNFREILIRKPFLRPTPDGYMQHGKRINDAAPELMPDDNLTNEVYTEEDFIRELHPSSHAIYDHLKFPDVLKKDPETGKLYLQPVTRYAVAFQQLIALKHLIHIMGNDTQFELTGKEEEKVKEEKRNTLLLDIVQTWLDKNNEFQLFEAYDAIEKVANAAVVASIKNRKVYFKTLSFLKGDKLYPHYDSTTGELTLFARQYNDYDETGKVITKWVEVWDETYIYRAKQDIEEQGIVTKIKNIFGLGGYKIVSKKPHGFPFIPIAYFRNDDGPAWSAVQNNIEDFEEAFSYLAENNKAYGFPIFYANGNGDEIDITSDLNGAVKAISLYDKDAKVGFLNPEDASAAFKAQLDLSYKLIYEMSFTVQPPELKSGDLPGIAVKLLFSPAVERAMAEAQMLSPFVNKVAKMTAFACGYEKNKVTDYMTLDFYAYIEPYIHQNDTELITNLGAAVDRNFLSHQTASERIRKYAKTDEIQRVWEEDLEKRRRDLMFKVEEMQKQTDENIREAHASQGGQDVNTGNGRKRETDENGNRPNENNWGEWNASH